MTNNTNASVELLPSGLRCNLDGAIGGTYRLPDGREFWMDGATVREVLNRIEPIIAAWIEQRNTRTSHKPDASVEERVAQFVRQWQRDQSEFFAAPVLEIVSEYAAWREALGQTLPREDWRPIESAEIPPFDPNNWFMSGERVLLWRPNNAFIGYYGYTRQGKGRWLSVLGRVSEPTHWMSLPAAPGEEQ